MYLMKNIDPYSILEISNRASQPVIKAAYQALVKIHHPDHGGKGDFIGHSIHNGAAFIVSCRAQRCHWHLCRAHAVAAA